MKTIKEMLCKTVREKLDGEAVGESKQFTTMLPLVLKTTAPKDISQRSDL